MKQECRVHGQNIHFHIGCLYIVTYIVSHSRQAYTKIFWLSLHDDDDDDEDDDNDNNNLSCPKFANFNLVYDLIISVIVLLLYPNYKTFSNSSSSEVKNVPLLI